MAEPVRIAGGYIDGDDNEGYHAQVDRNGNLRVREGHYAFLNYVSEDTNFQVGDSPATFDFNLAASRNAIDGWIVCDEAGDIQVDFSRDGLTFGEKFTMKSGEIVHLLRLDIDKIRVTHTGTDSFYRIFLI